MGLRTFLGIKKKTRDRIFRRALPLTSAGAEEILAILRILRPQKVVGHNKIRIGSKADGGYVMIDDLKEVGTAVSLGIGNEWSWDTEIADRGIDVLQYDHTLDGSPTDNKLFLFHRLALASTDSTKSISLNSIAEKASVKGRAVLKMDVQGAEWDALDAASNKSLAAFDQIVAEFHRFRDLLYFRKRQRLGRVLAKLNCLFQVVHVHGNNAGGRVEFLNHMIPNLMEITLANRARYRFEQSNETFPTDLDWPNLPNMPEIKLGNFSFDG